MGGTGGCLENSGGVVTNWRGGVEKARTTQSEKGGGASPSVSLPPSIPRVMAAVMTMAADPPSARRCEEGLALRK